MSRLLPALLLALALPVAAEVRELQWSDLIPPGAPPPPPPVALHDLSQLADALEAEAGPAAMQQSPAAPVVEALDGVQVKLPGYIVPLDMSEEGRVTEFLLVPYFGACIHVPPPPSNQIVHATSELGGSNTPAANWPKPAIAWMRRRSISTSWIELAADT